MNLNKVFVKRGHTIKTLGRSCRLHVAHPWLKNMSKSKIERTTFGTKWHDVTFWYTRSGWSKMKLKQYHKFPHSVCTNMNCYITVTTRHLSIPNSILAASGWWTIQFKAHTTDIHSRTHGFVSVCDNFTICWVCQCRTLDGWNIPKWYLNTETMWLMIRVIKHPKVANQGKNIKQQSKLSLIKWTKIKMTCF